MSTVFLHPKRKTYYHRSQIPLKLRPHFKGRIEFWRSLKTEDKDIAVAKSALSCPTNIWTGIIRQEGSMDTVMKAVQNARGRRRQWSSEQKLTVLQEWQAGVPLEEICRKYAVSAAQMYRWKRSLDQGLKESGKLVPKSLVGGLQKRAEALERALGRKALEVDVLTKTFELKGLKLPEEMYGG